MTATPFDSAHLHRLFPAGDLGKLFSDSAEIRAMMIVLGALAKVQGAAGLIPETSAQAIHRASLELQIDPGGLAAGTLRDGSPVPELIAAFRSLMQAPEHARHLGWGVCPQDIEDSALMLRLRQVLTIFGSELTALLASLAVAADARAESEAGALVAGWGWPLLALRDGLPALRSTALRVSLTGLAELGPKAPALRTALAEALNLGDPGHGWHGDRRPVLAVAGWSAGLATALAKIGQDLAPGATDAATGVAASIVMACGRHVAGLLGALHQPQDMAARCTEWLSLPQLLLSTGAALHHARSLAETLTAPDAPLADSRQGTAQAAEEARRFVRAVRTAPPA
ncbi:adenylosuccinate lyase family protein [Salipiger sp. P9]|uniref:adenylosuccinate lyase family protein n=1 Tax=Salipiger pentaromativorans TaxID=2943193 RepID=UPI00215807F4|nr:adenylosuccinate lyase family protein [Salipiger pentaromativorans]MCR8547923.1 adenylosuccinate lyase family protein [Salipiger pentaromativorans]